VQEVLKLVFYTQNRITMSQILNPSGGGGGGGGSNIQEIDTQDGNAVPSANIIIIDGFDTNQNNDDGITVKGGAAAGDPPGTGATNEVTIYLTNRNRGAVTTTDATPTTLISESLGSVAGTYFIEATIVAYNITDGIGASYGVSGAARTDGLGNGTEIASEEKEIFEDAGMATCDFNFGVSGNNAFIEIIGIAGKTINWKGLSTYLYVGP
jgi:hypothetical protein